MSEKLVLTKSQQELIGFLFEHGQSAARVRISSWVSMSTKYASFVEGNKDKIRKKLRVTQDPDAAEDLLHELEIPFWLLQNRRFEIAYEPYAASGKRGPDYAVTFRTNFTFNIEITTIRGLLAALPPKAIDPRLVDVLCGKLTQLIPNMANVLLLIATRGVNLAELETHISWIKQRAESRDQTFYSRHSFSSPSEFFKYFERLSAICVRTSLDQTQTVIWQNSQARVKLPSPISSFLKRGFDEIKPG